MHGQEHDWRYKYWPKKMIHNWNEVKQGLIDDLASIKKESKEHLLKSISEDIKSASGGAISPTVDKNSVKFETNNLTEAQNGKAFFDAVFQNINQSYIDNNS